MKKNAAPCSLEPVSPENRKKLLKLAAGVQDSLQLYHRVRSIARWLPKAFKDTSSKEEYMKLVQVAPITDLKSAWTQEKYLDYLRELTEEQWVAHRKDVVHMRDS